MILALAAVSFDGLRETFRWVAFLGVNPLDSRPLGGHARQQPRPARAPGRLTAAAILGAVALGDRLAGRGGARAPRRTRCC